MLRLSLCGSLVLCMIACATAQAQSVKLSIAIRENNTAGDIFGDGGGSGGGIEWVNRDGQTLTADGTWQLFSYNPVTDPLLAFAGTTANSMLEPGHEFAVLEHIRVLNDQGITQPIRIWIDDVTNAPAAGAVVQNFDSATLGTEVMFQEPGFSGSTAGNMLPGTTTAVSDEAAFSGLQSLQLDLQFVDSDPSRWARVTSFGTPNQPNPRIRIREATGGPVITSFYARMEIVPEPTGFALIGTMALVACARRRR